MRYVPLIAVMLLASAALCIGSLRYVVTSGCPDALGEATEETRETLRLRSLRRASLAQGLRQGRTRAVTD